MAKVKVSLLSRYLNKIIDIDLVESTCELLIIEEGKYEIGEFELVS